MAETAALEFDGVSLAAGGGPPFPPLSFRIAAGQVAALTVSPPELAGPVFGLAAGVVRPGAGRVKVLGRALDRLSPRARSRLQARVGCVFESGALISNQDLAGNLGLPLRFHTGLGEAEIEARIRETAGRFELAGLLAALPGELTGRQRARAALARALILGPELLLLQNPPEFIRARALDWAGAAAGRPAVVIAQPPPAPAEAQVEIRIEGNGVQS